MGSALLCIKILYLQSFCGVCVYSVIFIIIVLYLIKSTGLRVVGGIMVILQ